MSSTDTIREQYHQRARLIASGRSATDVAHMLATSERQLSRLMADPTFRDLVARYRRSENAPCAHERFQYLYAA